MLAATVTRATRPLAAVRQFARQYGLAATAQPVADKIKFTKLLINGEFVDSKSGRTFETINPATEEVVAHVADGGAADVDLAVAAARQAFESGPWVKTPASERGRILYRLADLIEQNIDELAAIEALDNGKPFHVARNIDLQLAIKCYRYYAGWADKIHGKVIPMEGPYFCYTRHEPVGVAAQIIPWNFPALMMAWKIGPVLAAGCTVVLKPAEQTPLSALYVGDLLLQAGLPAGVVNIVTGAGEPGAALARHNDVDKVAFTGSTEVGHLIQQASGTSNLKRVTLELGGKSPNIIFDDCDIDAAIAQSQLGLFLNQGQCCIAGSRLFVQEGIYDKFVEKSVQAAAARKLGSQFDASVDQGPQVSKEQLDKILGYISTGQKEGATLETGGKRWGDRGFFVEPTVFTNVEDDHTIAKEEIFGPVMSILKFKDEDEIIARANNTCYGLGAGLMTNNIERAHRMVNALKCGTVYVNCYDVFSASAPFGGFKKSGIGRELGEYALDNYLEVKTVIMKMDERARF